MKEKRFIFVSLLFVTLLGLTFTSTWQTVQNGKDLRVRLEEANTLIEEQTAEIEETRTIIYKQGQELAEYRHLANQLEGREQMERYGNPNPN